MPTYEYECEMCGKITERVESIEEHKRLITCECGGAASQIFRKAPAINLNFKGSYTNSQREDAAPARSQADPKKLRRNRSGLSRTNRPKGQPVRPKR